MFACKGRVYQSEDFSNAHVWGRLSALPTNIRLGWYARDKHSSLSKTFVNYGSKKFYNIGPKQT
jgi:hypothetical protein